MRSHLVALTGAVLVRSLAEASSKVSPTPPMGFNNWARFQCNLNQTLFTETADAMASNGLLDAGFDRVNLDDCWPRMERTANGSLMWNETLFPDGLIWLGDYLKKKGLKFGIYEDAGNETCGGYPGSLGYEEQDAATFASWGIDYLKVDGCNVYPPSESRYKELYSHWHDVLSKMENPLVFSESAPAYFCCQDNLTDWYEVMDWVPFYGELARHSTDIRVYGNGTGEWWSSILNNYGENVRLARVQKPGYFNDPDFIIADFPSLTLDERRSQFALWSSFSAPLIISSYIPDLTKDELEYLTNKDIISIDQDPLGLQATLVSQDGTLDVLTKSLVNEDRLLTVFNRGNSSGSFRISMDRVGFESSSSKACKRSAKDLWTGKSRDISGNKIEGDLAEHATAIYRISSQGNECGKVTPIGMIFNTASLNCLEAGPDGKATFATCNAQDSQVWQVKPDGTVNALSNPSSCLSESDDSSLRLDHCSGDPSHKWAYATTGNLKNSATSHCLTEESGTATAASCGVLTDPQVFELPSGVLH
ncbi:MAG: hypothetical protein M4579_000119 [Chaenotheca gracillima]|nr:MAG: hypothetical protein M4579_000119 [Chaenotheca gracillima]